jgi:excisionase family DNA binding protein
MSNKEAPTPMLTVVEAAKALRFSESYTKQLISKGVLPSVRIGRARRVRRGDLDAYVAHLTPDIPRLCTACAQKAS